MTKSADPRRLLTEWDFLLSSLQGSVTAQAGAKRTSVTILAGFLGSGKTTMLRHLLQGSHGLKLAAVVNDIGAVNIDAALIANAGGDVIELTNGCSCCSLGPELGHSINELSRRAEPLDGILVEASGIADPAGMGAVVTANANTRLDGIITVLDASALDSWLDNPAAAPLFKRQLDAAHLLVLNKTDLIDDEAEVAATAHLAQLAPGRTVIATEQGRLQADLAIGAALRGARPEPAHLHHEAARFATRTIMPDGPVDRQQLAAFLASPPEGLLRVKGFVEVQDTPGRLQTVQAVGRTWSIEPQANTGAVKLEEGSLVLIGLAEQLQLWDQAAFTALPGIFHTPG